MSVEPGRVEEESHGESLRWSAAESDIGGACGSGMII
jgi:hypothetical protein